MQNLANHLGNASTLVFWMTKTEACAPMPLMSYLDEIADPRRAGYAHRDDLQEMLVIAICATLSNVYTFEDVAFWATQKEARLKRFLKRENGIPSHDTFNRVFRIMNPKTFEEAFRRWVSGLVTAVGGDGKTVCGSGDGDARAIHMVSAFATALDVVLGQEKVARKSKEITAIPELLNALLIKGYPVSIDAMGCQTEIAETIVAKDADYLLPVKGNQPTLLTTLQDRFALDQRDPLQDAAHCFEHIEESHGHLVVQRAWVAPTAGEVDTARWPRCTMLATVESLRVVGGKPSDLERRYYISSRLMTAEAFAKAVRGHWGIKNCLHWMLDVNFGEDAATVRKDFAADNLSRLEKIVLNVLGMETATAALGKRSLAKKRKLAAWDDSFRMAILAIKL